MPNHNASVSLGEIEIFHKDSESAFYLYFSNSNPQVNSIMLGLSKKEMLDLLQKRLSEADIRSTFTVLAKIEAAFRIDYDRRGRKRHRKSEPISKNLRSLYLLKKQKVRLEDIFDVWKYCFPQLKGLIDYLKWAFDFRHWVAHGRHWNNFNRIDFLTIYPIAQKIFNKIPLLE